jgi:hypothetical protein
MQPGRTGQNQLLLCFPCVQDLASYHPPRCTYTRFLLLWMSEVVWVDLEDFAVICLSSTRRLLHALCG